jgi:hypothetical protein
VDAPVVSTGAVFVPEFGAHQRSRHPTFWELRRISRDTKQTQEHRKDTEFRSLAVIWGMRWLEHFRWSEPEFARYVGVRTCGQVGSNPATSKGSHART